MDGTELDELDIKPKKIDAVGLSFYGERFVGYQRIGEVSTLISQFKDYYYEKRIKNQQLKMIETLRGFNNEIAYPQGLMFHPYTTQVRSWIKKWNADILRQQMGMREENAITTEKEVHQLIKTRGDENAMMVPSDGEIEAGTRTLAGELLNDAVTMLRDDQEMEDTHAADILIKRRNYIVNVFAHATKLVHGKAALMLKASEEKRNNASFLMSLLAKATSGKLSEEEMTALQTTYSTKKDEQPVQV